MLLNREHYDLMPSFEDTHTGRFDKEDKSLWPRGIIYQDGQVNEMFLAYLNGYFYSQADTRADIQNIEASRNGYHRDAKALHEALQRLTSLYESEFNQDALHQWRPDWLKSALERTNALEGAP